MVTHRISRRTRGLSNMEAEMSGRVYSARQHAIRVRRHRRKMRQRMTLNVILCALLVSSPERTVWTLPRNDWWARNVSAAIDINAWPMRLYTFLFCRIPSSCHWMSTSAQIFNRASTSTFDQLTVCFSSFVSITISISLR